MSEKHALCVSDEEIHDLIKELKYILIHENYTSIKVPKLHELYDKLIIYLESKSNIKIYYIKNAIVSSPERLVEELSYICSKQGNEIDELNQTVDQLKKQIDDGIRYFKMEVPLYSNEDGQEEINRTAEKVNKCIKIFKGEEKYELKFPPYIKVKSL